MMSDALYIYSKRYVVTSCIWNHLVYTWKCHVQKSRMSLCVICRYYSIPLVSLIKTCKILKFTSCEIEHNYCEQKVRVLATFVYAWYMGHAVTLSQLTSLCVGAWGHPVTLSWLASLCAGAEGHPVTASPLASLCAGAQGHPVTSSWLTSSMCQGHGPGQGIISSIIEGWSRSTSLQ